MELSFTSELANRLDEIRARDLHRELRRVDSAQGTRLELDGARLLNFSSNDYLGLSNHPALKEAAVKAIEQFGAGSGASRLICGSLGAHHELEAALAAFKRTEAALSFSSGYMAALGTVCALVGSQDIVVIDKLVHACVIDAVRLSGAKLRVYPHNDLNALEDILRWAVQRQSTASARRPQVLIVTESVFSMDGDLAPMRELAALKERYGAWLMVDEAHATGVFGRDRRGLAAQMNVADKIDIQMGTLGKALGASGGYICGSRTLVDYLVNRARTFIFSTAPVPAAAAAARAGVELAASAEGEARCRRLWARIDQAGDALIEAGWQMPAARSTIVPLILGGEAQAVDAARRMRELGFFIPAIRYPTVARGKARLRLTLTADHSHEDVVGLLKALAELHPGGAEGVD